MQFKSLFAIAAAFVAVSATPFPQDLGSATGLLGGSSDEGQTAAAAPTTSPEHQEVPKAKQNATCGNGQVQSCCNTDSGANSLVPIDPALCTIQVIGVIGQTCTGQTPACCTGNSDGTLNLNIQCDPISL